MDDIDDRNEYEYYCEKAQEDLANISRRLEALTPGGSEFHDSPPTCLRWIQGEIEGKKKLIAKIAKLQAKTPITPEAMDRADGWTKLAWRGVDSWTKERVTVEIRRQEYADAYRIAVYLTLGHHNYGLYHLDTVEQLEQLASLIPE